MTKNKLPLIKISLSPYWQKWLLDEAVHAGVSESKLIEEALQVFQDSLVKAFEERLAKARRPKRRVK
jgi:hypothetical protein